MDWKVLFAQLYDPYPKIIHHLRHQINKLLRDFLPFLETISVGRADESAYGSSKFSIIDSSSFKASCSFKINSW